MTSVPGTGKVITLFIFSLKEAQDEVRRLTAKFFFIALMKNCVAQIKPFVQQYARWVVLEWALTFRLVCSPLRKAYPDLVFLQNKGKNLNWIRTEINFTFKGLLKDHERIALEKVSDRLKTLSVLEWKLAMLKVCARQSYFNTPGDLNRNIDALVAFKKTCWNAILFVSKNIPFALIQASKLTKVSASIVSVCYLIIYR